MADVITKANQDPSRKRIKIQGKTFTGVKKTRNFSGTQYFYQHQFIKIFRKGSAPKKK